MKELKKEEVKLVEKIIYDLATEHKDKDVLSWLRYSGQIYQAQINAIKNDKALPGIIAQNDLIAPIRKEFLDKIQALYWQFPNAIELEKSVSSNDPLVCPYHRHKATLVESKKWILKQVLDAWYSGDTSEWCIDLFRFIVKAYTPKLQIPLFDVIDYARTQGEDIKKLSDEEIENRGRERKVFRAEQDYIEALLRDRLKETGSSGCEFWIKQPNLPAEIVKIFAIARIRNSGKDFIMRDIMNADALRKFEIENRSDGALEVLDSFCERLQEIDNAVNNLLLAAKEKGCLGLVVSVEVSFSKDLGRVGINILPKKTFSYSKELLWTIFDKTKNFIEERFLNHDYIPGVTLVLTLFHSDTELWLNWEKKMHDL